MSRVFQVFLFLSLTFTFFGCSQKDVHAVFQTNGASIVREHTTVLQKLLLLYYDKLNKRNPIYTTKLERIPILYDIQNRTNNAVLPLLNGKKEATYKDYLNIAFNEATVKNRNDYLIAGIYKMLYWAYDVKRSHTVTTMQYDASKIQEANKMMQIIQYRIANEKDKQGRYLFITWQRAWQLDASRTLHDLQKFDYSKYAPQEFLKPSNMNFRVLSEGMLFIVQESLRYLGEESNNLGTSAIKSVFIFI